jgi:DNA segregation ATPase FtsK/SpoIIIE, S-DNA-T family
MLAETRVQIFEETKEKRLASLLKAFKIKVTSISLEEKEYFDIYDIALTHGERSVKIDRTLRDLGIALKAQSHPIGEAIMSRGVYRLHIQTGQIPSPSFSEVYKERNRNHYAPVGLGIDSHNSILSIDLNKLPNLLIGGTTGSGKSVLLHNLILSLVGGDSSIYLIDPKMVEFSCYEGLRAIKDIVHSVEDAIEIIEEITEIMEKRFLSLQRAGARSAKDYNLMPKKKYFMEPIILIVDEWADLTLQSKIIQKKLCLLAQKGRAAGVSIVLATQRPSAAVISGLIKANFPARIALKVASAVDSRVILDVGGAEKISEIGTGLYLDGTLSGAKLFRAPNIVDIDAELKVLRVIRKKTSFWSKFLS